MTDTVPVTQADWQLAAEILGYKDANSARAAGPHGKTHTRDLAKRLARHRTASEQSRVGLVDDLNGAVVAITEAAIMCMDADEDNGEGHAAFERRITPILTALRECQPAPADGLADELERLVSETKSEQDNIEYYSGGSKRNASAERLLAKFLEHHETVVAALRTTHSPSEAGVEARVDRWRKASIALGAWMSAALDDPKVCDAMKADINEWFSAGEPFAAALSLPSDPAPSEVEEAAKRIQKADPDYDDMRWEDIPERRKDAYRRDARAAISATSRPNDKTTELLREARGRLLALNVPDAEFLAEIDAHLGESS